MISLHGTHPVWIVVEEIGLDGFREIENLWVTRRSARRLVADNGRSAARTTKGVVKWAGGAHAPRH